MWDIFGQVNMNFYRKRSKHFSFKRAPLQPHINVTSWINKQTNKQEIRRKKDNERKAGRQREIALKDNALHDLHGEDGAKARTSEEKLGVVGSARI